MSIPVRPGISIFNVASQAGGSNVMCQQHSVAVTVFSDYAIWCDTHGSYITPDQTTNFISNTAE